MARTNPTPPRIFISAHKAIADLLEGQFFRLTDIGTTQAVMAHSEIEQALVASKSSAFFRHFVPLRTEMIALIADAFRSYFKVALAHPSQTGNDPDMWAQAQLQPAVCAALEWIRDWYILACDGEGQSVRTVGSIPYVPGQTGSLSIPTTAPPLPPPTSWRAPAWIFQVSLVYFGIGRMKPQHVPARDTEERLGAAHTRLLLKGARRVFLWELGTAVETVRNEETAAAGAIPQTTGGGQTEEPNKRKDSKNLLKGVDGLVRKADLSQYMHSLTEKQQLAFSLKFEYELGLAEIASRMGLDRKTAYEHIEAAKRKIDQARSNEKSKAHRPKSEDE